MKSNKSVGGRGKLCLAFILMNEGKTIARAIEAFHHGGIPIYDYLIVGIDNKTTDNTRDEVLKYCYAENIIPFDFNEDFGGSRNKILKEIDGIKEVDWCFMPDGHEILKPGGGLDAVKFFVEGNAPDIKLVSCYVEIPEDELKISCVTFPRPMFFKNHEGIFFERKVHNFLSVDNPEHKALAPEIRLLHDMPKCRKKARKIQRQQMNAKELRKNVKSGDVRDLYYLANTHAEMEEWDKAIETYREYLGVQSPDNDMNAQVCVSMCQIYYTKQDWLQMKYYALLGIGYKYNRAELYYYLGFQAVCRADAFKETNNLSGYKAMLAQSVHWFNICCTIDMPVSIYFIQSKYYTWLPYDALMDVYNRLGNLCKGLECAEKLLVYKPKDEILLKNIVLFKDGIRKHGVNPSQRNSVHQEFVKSAESDDVTQAVVEADPFNTAEVFIADK